MSNKTSFFNKKDIVILSIILLISIVLLLGFYIFSNSSGDTIANIYVGDTVYKSIKISSIKETEVITVNSKLRVLIEVSEQGVRFLESPCPDKICINTGIINKPHESASCLPARVVVLIE
ncbi:MAG: NusG domain II-containing protein [Oscillospiraceae bacterium]|nr:NusG domain II-containing protein [Oscillospiraceae bacterium]